MWRIDRVKRLILKKMSYCIRAIAQLIILIFHYLCVQGIGDCNGDLECTSACEGQSLVCGTDNYDLFHDGAIWATSGNFSALIFHYILGKFVNFYPHNNFAY